MKSANSKSATAIVGHASECVRKAIEHWNDTDVSRVAGSRELLESAVADLKQVDGVLERKAPPDFQKLSALVTGLKEDLNNMAGVVDACLAFQNDMARDPGSGGSARPRGSKSNAA